MSITELKLRFDTLLDESTTLQQESDKLFNEWCELDYGDPRRDAIYERIELYRTELMDALEQLDELQRKIWREEKDLFVRPDGWIMRFFTRPLAPHPEGIKTIDITDDIIAEMPKYRFAPLLLFIGVMGSIVTLALNVPWLLVSPLSLFLDGVHASDGSRSGVATVIAVVIALVAVVATLVNRRAANRFVHKLAIDEELAFRSGAENWTAFQRIKSCLLFGCCHVINLFYPAVTLLVLCGAGAVFMMVYLRCYRRTGSTYQATLASARFHAVYNIYAYAFIVLLVALLPFA